MNFQAKRIGFFFDALIISEVLNFSPEKVQNGKIVLVNYEVENKHENKLK